MRTEPRNRTKPWMAVGREIQERLPSLQEVNEGFELSPSTTGGDTVDHERFLQGVNAVKGV